MNIEEIKTKAKEKNEQSQEMVLRSLLGRPHNVDVS